MAKDRKGDRPKSRDPIARELRQNRLYKLQVVPDKTQYDRTQNQDAIDEGLESESGDEPDELADFEPL